MSIVENKKQGKGIQCKECESFGNIQSKCANTLKKKGKSLKTTCSNEDLDGSKENNDHVSNYVGFQVTYKKDVTSTISNNVAMTKAMMGLFHKCTSRIK